MRTRPLSKVELDRRRLERGVQILHAAVEEAMQAGTGCDFAHVFRKGVPPLFAREAAAARADVLTYQEKDRPRLELRKFHVPRRRPPGGVELTCGIVVDPQSKLFKVWARAEACEMLVVQWSRALFVAPGGETVPLARFVISVLPDSGLTLEKLGAVLDRRETQTRSKLIRALNAYELDRGRKSPRIGFNNSDPWYDGRSVVLAHTIVDAPRQGSVLQLEEVIEVIERLYGPATAARTQEVSRA
jgi:hypothetical protein